MTIPLPQEGVSVDTTLLKMDSLRAKLWEKLYRFALHRWYRSVGVHPDDIDMIAFSNRRVV